VGCEPIPLHWVYDTLPKSNVYNLNVTNYRLSLLSYEPKSPKPIRMPIGLSVGSELNCSVLLWPRDFFGSCDVLSRLENWGGLEFSGANSQLQLQGLTLEVQVDH